MMRNNLRDVPLVDLLCELSIRTIRKNRRDVPTALVALVCKLGCCLESARQRYQLAAVLRDCADELEKTEFVGAQFGEKFSPNNLC